MLKKILQLNKSYYPVIGGIEKVVQQVAEGLANDFDMNVLACSESHKTMRYEDKGVNVIKASTLFKVGNLPISLSFFHYFHKLVKQMSANDIIQLHMPFPPGDFACLTSGFKGKIFLWWHSDVVRQKKMMFFYKPVLNRMLKRADKIFVATEGHINGSQYLKPYRDKCVIVPYAVNEDVERAADSVFATRENLCFENDAGPLRFLFAGRLVYYKGCEVLLDAFEKLISSGASAELIIVGEGPLRSKLEQLSGEHNLPCIFKGAVSDEELCLLYNSCDVFVLPSVMRSEAFGLVQIEAMSFRKPVINTRLQSGVPYVSVDGETGLTVEPGNAEELAKAMQWMYEHKEERLLMGIKARETAKSKYSFENLKKKIIDIYSE